MGTATNGTKDQLTLCVCGPAQPQYSRTAGGVDLVTKTNTCENGNLWYLFPSLNHISSHVILCICYLYTSSP